MASLQQSRNTSDDKMATEPKSLEILDKQLPAPRKAYSLVKERIDTELLESVWVGLGWGLVIGFLTDKLFGLNVLVVVLLILLLYIWLRYRSVWRFDKALKTERFEDLLDMARTAIEKHPKKIDPYCYAAAACLSMHRPDDALGFYDQAISIKPQEPVFLLGRAQAYGTLFDGEHALADVNEFIRLRPNKAIGYFVRATAFYALYRYEDAIKDVNRAIELNVSKAFELRGCRDAARVNRALFNLGLNKLNEATAECEELFDALSTRPSAHELGYVLQVKGLVLKRRSRFDEAIADFTQALEMCPKIKAPLLIHRSDALCALGRFDEALIDLDLAEKQVLFPYLQANVHRIRASVYLRKGEIDRAVEEANKGTNVRSDLPPVLSTYGLVLMHAGQLDKAKTMLDQAISLDPCHAEAYWFRHELYEKLNEPEKAANDKQIAETYEYKPYI